MKSCSGMVCPWCFAVLFNPSVKTIVSSWDAKDLLDMHRPMNRVCVTCGRPVHVWGTETLVVVRGHHPLGGRPYWLDRRGNRVNAGKMAPSRRLDEYLLRDLVAEHVEAGYSLDEIARAIRVPVGTIRRIRKESK